MDTRTKFPAELVRKLNKHPYVKKATEWTVSFTPDFKKLAYDEYLHGKSIRQIFTEAGIDPEDLV